MARQDGAGEGASGRRVRSYGTEESAQREGTRGRARITDRIVGRAVGSDAAARDRVERGCFGRLGGLSLSPPFGRSVRQAGGGKEGRSRRREKALSRDHPRTVRGSQPWEDLGPWDVAGRPSRTGATWQEGEDAVQKLGQGTGRHPSLPYYMPPPSWVSRRSLGTNAFPAAKPLDGDDGERQPGRRDSCHVDAAPTP